MSVLLADIDATCSSLGFHDGTKYYKDEDTMQSLKHLIWILRRDNLDSHEYRRYIGHKNVIQTDLLPMLVCYNDDSELFDLILRLMVNLTNPTLLFFREDLPKDGAGRRTYLDLIEISQTYKEVFAFSLDLWETLSARFQKIMEVDVGVRPEEQSLIMERILVLTRNVLQVPSNPQHEKRVDNDISIHDKIIWSLQESGMSDLILYILSSEYENQFQLHALEIIHLMFREQKVETLADASVQRSAAEKQSDEKALVAARRMEKAKAHMRLPPARHSRFGGTYVYKNMKSVSDRDLICHQPLERVVEKDFNRDKQKVKSNFRLARDDDKYERQSAFCIRVALREFCIEILNSAYNNMIRQVRRVLERNHSSAESSGHDQSYLLWAMRFFLEFNRLNGFDIQLISETLSIGTIHWICNQIQHDSEMIQTDKKSKIKWNRRLQLGILAYREFLLCLQAMELEEDLDTQALLTKLRNNIFYVVEYREIVLHLLLSYNENHFTRNYLRDLIDTTNVYLKMMEKFCQGSIVVQTRVKSKPKRKVAKTKKLSKEEVLVKLASEWDERVSANLSVVLTNDINLPEEEHPVPFDAALEKPIDEQRGDCMTRLHKLLRDEDFERAVLLMRAGRACWPDSECFGAQDILPEDELMLMKEIYMADLETEGNEEENSFWDDLDNSGTDNEGSEDEEESSAFKEVVLNFSDFEKRLLNPKVIRACTWCLQTWEKMSYREIKSAVTLLHRIAVNLDVPLMLMQAQLFRVFQQVFNAPRDSRYEELRRLGIFLVRQFVKMAPGNKKMFAELLFFKSQRECFEIAHGYTESFGGVEAKQKGWSEEQEEELRRLFMENQESPQTDQDVIDWILENLIEKSRSRRGVIKKLKELGLIFKAPTKKSSAAAANKNLFIKDEDDKLRELYDEHRLESDCLKRIMEVFNRKRSKKAVVKRMVQLGLIADESEILPTRKPRNREKRRENNSSESSASGNESDNAVRNTSSKRILTSTYQMDHREVSSLVRELEESLKEGIDWIIESLKEAVEDFEEVSDDSDDAIPIVPFSECQKEALENPQFQKLLLSINMQPPQGTDVYWKIPANMIPVELSQRAKVLAGEEVVEEQVERKQQSEDEDEDLFSRLRAQRDALAYNRSDNEDKRSSVVKNSEKKVVKTGKPNTKTIQQLLPKIVKSHGDALNWIVTTLEDKARNKSSSAIDEMLLVPSTESHRTALTDKNFTKILQAINIISPDGVESYWQIPKDLTAKEILDRAKLLEVDQDSSEDEDAQMVIKRKRKQQNNGLEINTQELKQRLAELDDSSDEESLNESNFKSKRNVLESSDEDDTVQSVPRKSDKRDRSEVADDTPDENEMNATNNQLKRIKRIVDSSDED